MVPPFDIFRLTDGQPRWVEAAQDLELAKSRVAALGERSPGQYMIYSQKTGNKLVINAGMAPKTSANVKAPPRDDSSVRYSQD